MKHIVVKAKHTEYGKEYFWRINEKQMLEVLNLIAECEEFIFVVETQYGSSLVKPICFEYVSKKEANKHKKLLAVLKGYTSDKIKEFYGEESKEDLDAYASSPLLEEVFLEEEFEDIEE